VAMRSQIGMGGLKRGMNGLVGTTSPCHDKLSWFESRHPSKILSGR
jgi:hypothetical protein